MFVNMAYANLALFASGSPVKFVGKNSFPVSLMVISIQESFLRSPGLFGNSATIPIYKVTGHPLHRNGNAMYYCGVPFWGSRRIWKWQTCWSIGHDLPDQDPFQVRDCKSKFITSLWWSFSLMNTIDQHQALSSQADPRTLFACSTWPLLSASMGSLIRHLIPLRSLVCPPLPTYIFVSDWYVIPVPIFDGRGSPSHPAFLFSNADFEKLPRSEERRVGKECA